MNLLDSKNVQDETWISIFRYVDQQKDRYTILLTCKKWNKLGIMALDHSAETNSYIKRLAGIGPSKASLVDIHSLLKNPTVDPSRDKDGSTTCLASISGHFEMLEELLKDDDDRVDPFENNYESLGWLIQYDNWVLISKILDRPKKYRDETCVDRWGAVIHIAKTCVEQDRPKILENILSSERIRPIEPVPAFGGGYIRTSTEEYLWSCASAIDNGACLNKLMSCDAMDPSAGENSAVRSASKEGCLGNLKILLGDKRVNPGAKNNEAIVEASKMGFGDVVVELMTLSSVDPLARDNFVLIEMCRFGRSDIVQRLLALEGTDPSADKNYALKKALRNKHFSIARMLLKDPRIRLADVKVRDFMDELTREISRFWTLAGDKDCPPFGISDWTRKKDALESKEILEMTEIIDIYTREIIKDQERPIKKLKSF